MRSYSLQAEVNQHGHLLHDILCGTSGRVIAYSVSINWDLSGEFDKELSS